MNRDPIQLEKMFIRFVKFEGANTPDLSSDRETSRASDELIRCAKRDVAKRREIVSAEIQRDVQNEWKMLSRQVGDTSQRGKRF